MDKNALKKRLKKFGLNSKEDYIKNAFARNIGLLTWEEQEKLANAKVAIPGMGGVGGIHLITLVRTGVGHFNIADFDTYEPANINRQFGARVLDFDRSKLEVMKEQAFKINPFLKIREFPEGLTLLNVDDFLDGVQVVIDSLDYFKFGMRRLLFKRALEKGVYVVTAGPMGFSSAMLIFSPHSGMGFDEYFNIVEGMTAEEHYIAYGIGLAPRATHFKYMDTSKVDLETKKGPSLGIACQICAGMAATEAVRIILNKGGIKPVPYYFQFDPFTQKYRKGKLHMGNRNPIQKIKMKAVKLMLEKNKIHYKSSIPDLPCVDITPDHLPEEIIYYIMRAGIQAPSGDNAQPWRFSHQDNTLYLFLDRAADQSFFNINQIASIISCGAVLENMQIAARSLGLKAVIDYLPSAGKNDLMASVTLNPIQREKGRLADSIWKRHTNRKFYEKRCVPSSVLQDLKSIITGFPGAKLQFVTEKVDLQKLAKIIYKVDRIRTEHRPLHEHLCRMIRFSQREAVKTRDGLPIKNLEAGLAGEIFLKATQPWTVMNAVNKIGLGRMVALHSYQGIINSSGAAFLTVDGMDTEDFLKGGQALERIWLAITEKGLCLQPMTAITLFWLRWQLEGGNGFSSSHRSLLRRVWDEYRILFPDVDFSKHGQVMLFRFGHGKEIKYWTCRKDVESFLINPDARKPQAKETHS